MQKDINMKSGVSYILCLIAIAVFGFAASAFIPITCSADPALLITPAFELLPIVLVISGFLLCYLLTRSIKPILPFGIIAILVLVFFGASGITAIIPLCFFSVALLGYLCKDKGPLWLVITAAAAYTLSILITTDPVISAAALLPCGAALVLCYSYKSDAMRVSSVLRMTLVLGLGALAILIAKYMLFGGELTIYAINREMLALRDIIVTETSELLYLTFSQTQEGLISAEDARAIASSAVSTVFNFLPAISVICLFVANYITHSLFIATVVPTEEDHEKIIRALTFKMSFTSAVVFLVTFLLSAALEYDGHMLYATALGNLYMILVPSFTIIAFGFIGTFVKGESASCLGYLVYISMLLMLFNKPHIVLPLASFAGALVVIITSIKEIRKNKKTTKNDR